MPYTPAAQFAPPPAEVFSFLIPISLQCLLLHPIAPPSLSRFARLALMPFSLYLATTATFKHGWQPREATVGLNFVLGVAAAYATWKTIEFGTARDLTPYTWIGFDDQTLPGKAIKPKKTRQDLEAYRRKQADNDSLADVLVWTGSLLLSMRGVGWAYGPAPRAVARHPPRDPVELVRQLGWGVVKRQFIFGTMSAVLLTPKMKRTALLARAFPSVSFDVAFALSEAIGTAAFGTAACCALDMGFALATILACIGTGVLRAVLPDSLRPPPFDARAYPPIFQHPWRPENVSTFWSCQWHSFFSRSFDYLGFQPVSSAVGAVAGKSLGRLAGVLAVFGLSSWLHEFALESASTGAVYIPPDSLPFATEWGSSIYFMTQGLGVVLEGVYTNVTGKRIRGPLATLWGHVFMAGLGYFVYLNWSTYGLFQGLPEADRWTWHRFVIPLTTILPDGVFVKPKSGLI